MTRLDQLTDEFLAQRSESLAEPAWLRDRRLEAYKVWIDQEWPKPRGEELWRDTPFRRFAVDVPIVAGGRGGAVRVELLDAVERLSARADLADGSVTVSVTDEATAAGVVVTDLREAASGAHADLVREHLGAQTADHDRTVTTNDAAWTAGVLVHVPPEVELDAPIGITVHAGQDGAHLPRLLVIVGQHAAAQVLLEHTSAGLTGPTTVDEVAEVVVGDGARLDFVSLQNWTGPVGHLAVQAARLHRDAELKHLAVTFGGETVRLRPELHLAGPGSRVEPLGVYFSDEGQHFEHHLFIEHVAGHAVSDVMYKGALQGKSRTVFRGHIYVHRDAVGSDSNEVNKNLILTEGAKADSTPFLEIECSEVTAGHGSATGQVDEDQVFYLESRGVRPDDALRLIVFGFFAEVLDRIGLPAVREQTMAYIAEELEHADLGGLLRGGSIRARASEGPLEVVAGQPAVGGAG